MLRPASPQMLLAEWKVVSRASAGQHACGIPGNLIRSIFPCASLACEPCWKGQLAVPLYTAGLKPAFTNQSLRFSPACAPGDVRHDERQVSLNVILLNGMGRGQVGRTGWSRAACLQVSWLCAKANFTCLDVHPWHASYKGKGKKMAP
jgi:hypothetical protein